ncbi:flagellar motor protein [Dasania sp. GY-MA-18]|uniref:Flagellar motor protein n=1 Tax=Dasania phycosphaerae TaxID=2950436 RepID=A0A9J6RI48_9GAMM|nr:MULTISPECIES: flagellar motor protein [Dasania]MCR8921680.1 flagellar motor protein [Dasania sp. GY-MA-18]MCZ0864108.1 flagellar motor protein [Dasania phycosphaerae]MCZ0867836.1 flagellar motor protein [Dasania phycosphaerae]
MDLLSIFGVILGFVAILGGNYLEGGSISALANFPAAFIVVGGTFAAAMLQTPWQGLKFALSRLRHVFAPPNLGFKQGVKKVVKWSARARKDGLLGLEDIAETEPDLFARKGLQLLVDGGEPENIRNILEVETLVLEQRDVDAAKFYESMGGYSPTIGIIGAVMGLIHVMGNLADPSKLGAGIAVAFVATIYGVAFANLLLLPIASKLRGLARSQAQYRELIIEGIIAIAEGENPRAIELKLDGFLHGN